MSWQTRDRPAHIPPQVINGGFDAVGFLSPCRWLQHRDSAHTVVQRLPSPLRRRSDSGTTLLPSISAGTSARC
ncbi:hypothetical protein KCP69_09285 [Salmonella enterica subsp. enterica]|nr:hypothetical protein KCP69_09285 [Salmonella enterica subsp. enterica]